MRHLSRRGFLTSTAALSTAAIVPSLLVPGRQASAAEITNINVGTRTIEVHGRPATVFGMTRPDGGHGIFAQAGQHLRVKLENQLDQETLIHWHGLTPPWQQDGVPNLSEAPIAPGRSRDYDFLLERPGTNWMHSHHGLQEQRLMAAPLIIRDAAEASADIHEVVVLFHDFTFRDPAEILAGLKGDAHGTTPQSTAGQKGLEHSTDQGPAKHGTIGHGAVATAASAPHLRDVEYDAFLANDRTLSDPQVFRVERGGRVRLRLINGATATNFWIDLSGLDGRLIAVDGMPIEPLIGRRFEFAIAQRLDIVLDLPRGEGTWPVFATREGDRARTGFVLATRGGAISKISPEAGEPTAPVGLALERRLKASRPLPDRRADRRHTITINEAPGYVWMLNGAAHGAHVPLEVREGERVEVTFVDRTSMAHPMHLHGHHFQIVGVDGERLSGAMRDTVLVPAGGHVTVAFDAINPGKWALHCHHLYHMAAGMMTTVEYPL